MLPTNTLERIREAILRGVTPERPEFVVPIAADSDSGVRFGVEPVIHWAFQDIEDQEPPYDEAILRKGDTVHEGNTPAELSEGVYLGSEELGGEVDADVRDIKGKRVYDQLVLKVVSVGQRSATIDGVEVTLPDTKRAGEITRAIHDFLTERWKTRPLDEFDTQGNLVDHSHLIYADELSPPVLPKVEPARMPNDVTDQVGRDQGSQWDAAIRAHYWDTSSSYELLVERGGVETSIDVTTTPGSASGSNSNDEPSPGA